MPTDPRPAQSRSAVQRHILTAPTPLELRAAGEGGAIGFRGHGIIYDRWTTIYDWWFGEYQERIAPGAASAHLSSDVRLLLNHDANFLLARTTNGTMRLTDDGTGVLVDADMAPTSYARDLAVLLERGDISQMSFSFVPGDEEWEQRPDGTWLRTITSFEGLYDMSIVTYPAYEETDAGLRARAFGRSGRRNSKSDEEVIRATAEALRTAAGDLDSLVEAAAKAGEEAEQNEAEDEATEDEERASAIAAQAARHQELMARFGAGRG